jgi:hypothetical protein
MFGPLENKWIVAKRKKQMNYVRAKSQSNTKQQNTTNNVTLCILLQALETQMGGYTALPQQ